MRQLVTIRKVREIIPIEGADRIELAKLDGWQCVVKKGEFWPGAEGLFYEIDSVLPDDDPRFEFMANKKFRVRTTKLRGALSQGLLMPLNTMTDEEFKRYSLGQENLVDIFRVQKYEPPVPIAGEQKGTFPTHLVPKTDQERIQNIPEVLEGKTAGEFEITEKLDGTSCTFFYHRRLGILVPQDSAQIQGERNPRWGACSRNWEMKLTDDNVYSKLWRELDLHQKLAALGRNLAIQGEIIGPKIQGNKYKRAKQEFYVFDIYDIDQQRYLRYET
jgi:RNA ligase (TIGR02306 family)